MLEPGCVAVIPFPFTDLSSHKRRPVLVLTAPDTMGDVICMAVTSKAQHGRSVAIRPGDFATGTLPVASFIRADKVYTLSTSLVVREVGCLHREALERALAVLCDVLQPQA